MSEVKILQLKLLEEILIFAQYSNLSMLITKVDIVYFNEKIFF